MTLSKRHPIAGTVLCALLIGSPAAAGPRDSPPDPPPDPVAKEHDRAERAARTMRVGDAKLRLGDMRGACAEYEKTHKILPSWWMPHLALVRCGRFVGLPLERLVEHAAFAVKARPEIPITHVQYGLVLEEAGRSADAIAAYQAALRRYAGLPEARYRLGTLLARNGRHAAAARHLERAIAMRPELIQARWDLVRLYETIGRVADAESGRLDLLRRSRNPRLAMSRLIRFYARQKMASREQRFRARFRAQFERR